MRFSKNRGTGFRRGTPRKPTLQSLAAAVRKKEPRRYNWVTLLDSPCQMQGLPQHTCLGTNDLPPTEQDNQTGSWEIGPVTGGAGPVSIARPTGFHLWYPDNPDPADGATQRHEVDDVTIVRIVGGITFIPVYYAGWKPNSEVSYTCDEIRQMRAYTAYFFRAGLKKESWLLNAGGDEYTPPVRDPLMSAQWSDGRFLKMWQKERNSSNSVNLADVCTTDELGVYGDVDGTINPITGGGGTLAAGSGTILNNAGGDGIIVTSQANGRVNLTDNTSMATTINHGQADRAFYLNLSSSKRMRFRESEGLTLWVNYTAPQLIDFIFPNQVLRNPGIGWLIRPHIKALLET